MKTSPQPSGELRPSASASPLLERPAIPTDPQRVGTYAISYHVPASWLPERWRDGARVFEALLEGAPPDERVRAVFEAGEAAGRWAGGVAIALLGVRWAIVRNGWVLATTRNPTAESLEQAIRDGLELVDAMIGRQGEEADARDETIVEKVAALDLLRESAGPLTTDELEEARRHVRTGALRSRGGIFLRLLDEELQRRERARGVYVGPKDPGAEFERGDPVFWDRERGVFTAKPTAEPVPAHFPKFEHVALSLVSDPIDPACRIQTRSAVEVDVWSCAECPTSGLEKAFDHEGVFRCPACHSRQVRRLA
jgi:hypothetical protein